MQELKSKVAVITGAGRGLGRALAYVLNKEGARLALGDITEEVKEIADEIGAVAVISDVANESDVSALAEIAVQNFGQIDIWINNAGIWLPHAPLEEVPIYKVRKMMEVNFLGTFFGCREAILKMKLRGEGIILNIISIRAKDPRANETAYTASKFAADGLTKALREELRPFNIKVIGVYPGGMRTELFKEKMPENYSEYMDPLAVAEKIVANLKSQTPEEELIIKRLN